MSKDKSILTIKNVVAGYNKKIILNNINLLVDKGDICSVIGEEGSGKSTFLKVITNQIPYKGTIYYNDIFLKDLTTDRMISHGVDFIVQGGNILKSFTVEEHIQLALSVKSKRKKGIKWDELEVVFPNIERFKKQIAGRLSGGERMLLSFSCLLATDADIFVLDEPTAGLAPEICDTIKGFLLRMKKEHKKTILLFEHNYDFAFELSDSVVILKEGKLSSKFFPNEFKQTNFIDKEMYSNTTKNSL